MKQEVLDYGVPNEVTIPIRINDLVRISSDREKTIKTIDKLRFDLIVKVSNLLDDKLLLYDPYFIEMFFDLKLLHNVICFSPNAARNNIFELLDLYNYINEDKHSFGMVEINSDMDELIANKLKKLSTIKTKEELQKEFKSLYNTYLRINETYKELSQYDKYDEKTKIRIFNNMGFGYNTYNALKKCMDINYFKEYMSKYIIRLKNKEDKVGKLALENPIDVKLFKEIPDDKLRLYLVNQYINIAEISKNKEYIQKSLYYVVDYFNSKELSDTRIKLNDVTISELDLYKRLRQLLVDMPELNFINFNRDEFKNMSIEEVNSKMEEYFKELQLNFDFFNGNDENFDKEIIKDALSIKNEKVQRSKEELMEIYMNKKTFFDSTLPYIKLKGKNSFNGYIGYVYENGIVVLDKFFNNKEKGIISNDNAIYIIDIDELYDLSKHSKQYLIDNKLCKRIIHKGNWEDRVLEYVNNEKEYSKEKIKCVIKNKLM